MIDYEVKIFNRVHSKAAPLCAKNQFKSVYVAEPTALPAGSLIEMSNVTVRSKQSTSLNENFARIMYQLDCYAETKSACKKLYNAADTEMIAMGFIRISGGPIDNIGNLKVSRYTARYEAEIDPDGVIYRRG